MEDTQAILDRRKFLIQSALTGAGAVAVLPGCVQTCLSIEPRYREDPPLPDEESPEENREPFDSTLTPRTSSLTPQASPLPDERPAPLTGQ
jgi:hypothetical protein